MSIVRRVKTEFGEVQVRRDSRTGALVYWQGAYHQSETDGAGVSLSTYIHALFGLATQSVCKRVLLIGGAAGILGTMLHRAGAEVTIVDVNAQAFEIARAYFKLPAGVECVVEDGFKFLQSSRRIFDVIVLDAYDGNQMPAQFLKLAFARLVKQHLHKARGRLLINAYVVHGVDRFEEKVARRFARVFETVRILDEPGDNNRNVIVMAGAVSRLTPPELKMKPAIAAKEIAAALSQLAFLHFEVRRDASP